MTKLPILRWIKIEDVSPYVETADYVHEREDYSLIRRLYSHEGKKYPIFTISIHANPEYSIRGEKLQGLKISSAYKEKEGDWWSSNDSLSYIPLELLDDLGEMLAKVKDKLK